MNNEHSEDKTFQNMYREMKKEEQNEESVDLYDNEIRYTEEISKLVESDTDNDMYPLW